MTNLKARVITAVIAAPAVLAVIVLFGRTGLSLLVLAVVLGGLRELHRMLKESGVEIFWLLIVLVSCAFSFLSNSLESIGLILLISVLALLLRGLLSNQEPTKVLTRVVFSVFSIIFLPFLASFAVCLGSMRFPGRNDERGLALVILVILATWMCDTAAYFCGCRWGKHKALERISPSKTLEGCVAGVVASILTCLIVGWLIGSLSAGQAALLGVLLGVFGQLGDLCVSLVKRAAGRKDAGALLPGHGGVLDRVDSFLFNAPVAFMFFTIVLPNAA
ncbi:MAG TPA: phosphatidate cytidylyltransferase [bacterium]|nr:phosphatidate cytidylyltransferase [bacterium]